MDINDIRRCWEPRAPLNSAAPANFCREPNDVHVSIHNTFREGFEDAMGLPEKKHLISSPAFAMETQ